MINPPGGKGTYCTEPPEHAAPDAADWRRRAVKHEDSWWTDWRDWLAERSGASVPPPPLGSDAYPAIADAPGTYVVER